MPTVFRWCVWGDKSKLTELLPVSIATFRRAFRGDARYIVITDEPAEIATLLNDSTEVVPQGPLGSTLFNVNTWPTWRKFSPTPRLVPDATEFFVDADVFLVDDPTEIRDFCELKCKYSFLTLREAPGSRPLVGRLASRVFRGLPAVNIGLFGQRAGMDISKELENEFHWWSQHVPPDKVLGHDDQGALSAILSRYYLIGQVGLLPQDRYRIISQRSNRTLTSLDGVAAIHTTNEHEAFYRFRGEIEAFITR